MITGWYDWGLNHAELQHNHGAINNIDLLMNWCSAVREGTTDAWPRVTYYLVGANEWRSADAWPPADARPLALYLGPGGELSTHVPTEVSSRDRYVYDPTDPAPTVGGSIVSYVYTPGSADVSEAQERADVLTYTTPPLRQDLHVVGSLRLEIDMWATANRFKAGHRLRIDISSADFPRYDRNSNRGGVQGPPVPAEQCVYHDAGHPSHLLATVIGPVEH